MILTEEYDTMTNDALFQELHHRHQTFCANLEHKRDIDGGISINPHVLLIGSAVKTIRDTALFLDRVVESKNQLIIYLAKNVYYDKFAEKICVPLTHQFYRHVLCAFLTAPYTLYSLCVFEKSVDQRIYLLPYQCEVCKQLSQSRMINGHMDICE